MSDAPKTEALTRMLREGYIAMQLTHSAWTLARGELERVEEAFAKREGVVTVLLIQGDELTFDAKDMQVFRDVAPKIAHVIEEDNALEAIS